MTSKISTIAALALITLAAPALAEGDAAKGEKEFGKCKACHTIANGDEVIQRGGKTGPNLYGVVGRTAGTEEGFSYGASIVKAGEAGLVWSEEDLATYMQDPNEFLKEHLGDSGAKSKMTFKMKKNAEDVAAYLASEAAGAHPAQ